MWMWRGFEFEFEFRLIGMLEEGLGWRVRKRVEGEQGRGGRS